MQSGKAYIIISDKMFLPPRVDPQLADSPIGGSVECFFRGLTVGGIAGAIYQTTYLITPSENQIFSRASALPAKLSRIRNISGSAGRWGLLLGSWNVLTASSLCVIEGSVIPSFLSFFPNRQEDNNQNNSNNGAGNSSSSSSSGNNSSQNNSIPTEEFSTGLINSGHFAGFYSGAILTMAKQIIKREQKKKQVVIFSCLSAFLAGLPGMLRTFEGEEEGGEGT